MKRHWTISLTARLFSGRTSARGFKYTWRMISMRLRNFLEHMTLRKLANMLLMKAQKWLKIAKVSGMPYNYVIDPINVCNLRCPLCPTGLGTLGRSRGKLSYENFTRVIDQVAPYAYSVFLYNWGEPFLHPDIFNLIQYASSKRIGVKLSTNLNHFNREMAAKVVASGLDTMLVSVDGATQEVYEKYRRFGKLDTVFANLRLLVEEKRKANSHKPFIYMRMLVNKHNESQIADLRAIAEEIGVDAFTVVSLFVDTTDPEQVKEWLPSNETFSTYDYSAEQLTNVWHCDDLWEGMTINWDGGVAPCCWLHEHKNDFANGFERPIREIWNGEAYRSSRQVFAWGGPKAGPVETICTRCKGRPLYLKD